jgi:hypothetical protein
MEHVLSDEEIKNKIIKDYLESLSSVIPPKPIIMRGGEIAAVPPRKARTLEEAGLMAAELIKIRRN